MKATVFFLGKGGVGKTTSSASLAFYLSQKGYNTFWISIDPAHNLWDILGIKPAKGTKKINNSLWAEELDIDSYLKRFLEENVQKMKTLYRHLQIINLEHIFNVLRESPGMEEAAILSALNDVIERERERDYIIIDTPPTGLTLRILTLAFTTIQWIDHLMKLREKILKRRELIHSIDKEIAFEDDFFLTKDDDPVFKELKTQKEKAEKIYNLLKDEEKTKMVLVMNQDRLSLKESIRIKESLAKIGISIKVLLLNKFGLIDEREEHILSTFKDIPIKKLPFIKHDPIEKDALLKLAEGWAEYCI